LVEIERAWKNEIYDGSIPVGPGGITTSIGATDPTLAAVGTLFYSINGLTSKTGASEKIKPTLPLQVLPNISNCGIGLHNLFLSSKSGSYDCGSAIRMAMAFLIIVFFPTIISPFLFFLNKCLTS